MGLVVVREPAGMGPPHERCCICRKPTPYWYRPRDVALCRPCARITRKANVPTKAQWFAKEGK
jgi:recombinational DNA repair protein (RecF pathway)